MTLETLSLNPFDQLSTWLQEAISAKVTEPTAMMLATASLEARPSLRTVLLKGLDSQGLVFHTNYNSRKSLELTDNPQAAAVLLWKELDRQVTVEGIASKVSAEESDAYFASRPHRSQIGCWASEQGKVIESRLVLEDAYAAVERRYEGKSVPRPPHWGGWRITPNRFEFWEGREFRLHDRFQYVLQDRQWLISRLSP